MVVQEGGGGISGMYDFCYLIKCSYFSVNEISISSLPISLSGFVCNVDLTTKLISQHPLLHAGKNKWMVCCCFNGFLGVFNAKIFRQQKLLNT